MTQSIATIADPNLPVPQEKVDALVKTINFADPALTITYGASTMNEIAQFADSVLARVRAKDAGPIGETLTDLMLRVKGVDLTRITQPAGLLSKIPLLGSLFDSAKRTVAEFQTLSDQVGTITDKLEESSVGLLRDIEMLEQLYEHNKQFHTDLSLYIEAGKQRLEEARNVELPRLQKQAEESGDGMDAQAVRDFTDRLNRFERRLNDLQISRTITLQTAPQIRLIQSNNQSLAEKIQTSILSTIPIWKSQMTLALSINKQQQAARVQKEVADTTNAMLKKNADMLKTASVDTAREVERSIVDIETLRHVQQQLISSIEETLRISTEGREKRQAVEKELESMEGELRTKLTAIAAEKDKIAITEK